ncbi:hypothetical protein RB195_001335 [Necator americanus]
MVDGMQTSFLIESYIVVKGAVLLQRAVKSMRECSSYCLDRTDCGGFNYLIKNDGNAHCLIIDTKKQAKEVELPVPEEVLYAALRISLSEGCGTRTFAYEKFPHLKATSKEIFLGTAGSESLEQCLKKCQEKSDCRAAQFNSYNASCDLLRASPNFVYNVRNHFTYSDNTDVYENNCLKVSMSSAKCGFMRINSAGLTDFYDDVIPNIKDAEECEQVCIVQEKVADPCRSYTYDKQSKQCYVSHQDSRSAGRNPLANRNENLVQGSLDDCIDFALKCRNDALEIHGFSMRLFSGSMKTRRRKDVICEEKVSSSFDFMVKIPYKECGIDKINSPFPSHSGLVHVKEGSTNLITIRDKILQVNCHIHPQVGINDQILTTRMQVEDINSTHRTLTNNIVHTPGQSQRPHYTLTVLNADGVETDVVHSEDHGWLSIKINDDSPSRIFVSNMLARDVNTKETINLIGDDGCVTRRDYVLSISQPSPREIRYKISFNGFDEKSQFVFQALIETCTFECSPKCNQDLWLEGKEQKDLSENNVRVKRTAEPRRIELTQDIYKVHGCRVTILPQLNSQKQVHAIKVQIPHALVEKALQDEEVLVEMIEGQSIASALRHCFSDDITCLFTVVLASIQLFLLMSCICIICCYVQQWRTYRSVHESVQTQIQYEMNGENTLTKNDNRLE